MEVDGNYINTSIGIIPDDWETKNLGELCEEIQDGTHQTPKYVSIGIPFYSVEHVTSNNFTDTRFIAESEHKLLCKRCKPEKGDILLTRIGNIGSTKIIDWNVNASIYVSLALLRVKGNQNAKYIYCYSKSQPWVKSMEDRALLHATPKKINLSEISKIIIPLPPLPEQNAIAAVLSDTDDLIQSFEKLLAKKRFIKQGAIQKLLAPKDGWGKSEVQSLASITTGSKNTQDRIYDGKYPFFVRSQKVERINSYSFDGEAVLTAGDGVGTGKIFHYINGKFDIHQRVYKMTHFNDKISGYYFYLYFSNNFYNRIMMMTAKSSVDSVRREMIANMEIHFPSRDEQNIIEKILTDLETEIELLEKQLSKYRLLKQGLMQNLLTGKIRLKKS